MNKKRWRPSLTEYRALQQKLEEQISGTSVIVRECDEWREKYRALYEKYNEQLEGTSVLVSELNGWREKYHDLVSRYENEKTHFSHGEEAVKDEYELRRKYQSERDTLEKSNKFMEKELDNQRMRNEKLSEKNRSLSRENYFLKSRGFWDRVVNTKYVADDE